MAAALGPLIDAARRQGAAEPTVVVAPANADCAEALEKRIGVPVLKLDEEARIRRLWANGASLSCQAAGVLLDSLWPGAQGLNLLDKGYHKPKKVPKAVTGVLIALLLAIWVPYALLPLQREEKRLAEIERQISLRKEDVRKVEHLRKEVKDLTEEIALIDQFKHARPATLSVLKELTDLLPKSAWTTRIRMTDTGADIEGYAKTASGLLPILEQSKYLKKAEFASPIMRDAKMDKDRFVIKMEIQASNKREGERTKDEKSK